MASHSSGGRARQAADGAGPETAWVTHGGFESDAHLTCTGVLPDRACDGLLLGDLVRRAEGWVVFCRDQHILDRPAELQAYLKAKVHMFRWPGSITRAEIIELLSGG